MCTASWSLEKWSCLSEDRRSILIPSLFHKLSCKHLHQPSKPKPHRISAGARHQLPSITRRSELSQTSQHGSSESTMQVQQTSPHSRFLTTCRYLVARSVPHPPRVTLAAKHHPPHPPHAGLRFHVSPNDSETMAIVALDSSPSSLFTWKHERLHVLLSQLINVDLHERGWP